MQKRYITDAELASQSGLKVSFLRADRQRERRIPFVKIGRSVYYDTVTVFDVIRNRFGIGGDSPALSVAIRQVRQCRKITKR